MTSVGTQLDKIIIIINELHQKYYQLDKKVIKYKKLRRYSIEERMR